MPPHYNNDSLAHGHKFLSGCRVNRHSVVKVSFGGSHLDCHGESLQNLVAVLADDVQPHNLLCWQLAHKLHGRLALLGEHAVVHVGELQTQHATIIISKTKRVERKYEKREKKPWWNRL